MDKSKRVRKIAWVAGLTIGGAAFLNLAWAADPPNRTGSAPAPAVDKKAILQQMQSETVPGALKAIAAAKEAIQAGRTEQALAELGKAEQALKAIRTNLAQAVGPQFANTACPIMGTAIDPAKVPESLTRTYKGQKIAFCCSMCPPAWDKLSDAQKDAKLKAVLAPQTGQ